MRTVTFTCDRCGKKIASTNATKLNITLQRGRDSVEKKTFDFCSPCFVKMKKMWKNALSGIEPATKVTKSATIEERSKTEISNTESIATNESKLMPVSIAEDNTSSEKPVPKKRGRKPKPVNPEEWLNRTEIARGSIKAPEKDFILKLYAVDGLSVEEISKKLHRHMKGINQAINLAMKSGELDKLKGQSEKTKEEQSETELVNIFGRRRSSYVMPANTEVVDDKEYDIGGIMALHNAGWPPSEIAKEKDYDEDIVRLLIENHTS